MRHIADSRTCEFGLREAEESDIEAAKGVQFYGWLNEEQRETHIWAINPVTIDALASV